MSLHHSPSVVTDGLVLYYDMNNTQKSFVGAPTVNLLPSPTIEAKGYNSEFVQYRDLAPIFDVRDRSVVYSLSLDLKVKRAGSINVYMQNGSGTKYGFVGQSVYVTENYQRFKFNGLTATISTPSETQAVLAFYGGYGSGVIPSIKNVQVEVSPFATPFVDGTRTNTQSLLDITGKNVITASNLVYASDNTFSFNGANSHLSTVSIPNPNNELTVQCILKYNAANTYQNIFDRQSAFPMLWITPTNKLELNGAILLSDLSYDNQTVMITVTFSTSSPGLQLYVNGVLSKTVNNAQTAWPNPSVFTLFNRANAESLNGKAHSLMFYTRVLTAPEVMKNFNALRGRYGL